MSLPSSPSPPSPPGRPPRRFISLLAPFKINCALTIRTRRSDAYPNRAPLAHGLYMEKLLAFRLTQLEVRCLSRMAVVTYAIHILRFSTTPHTHGHTARAHKRALIVRIHTNMGPKSYVYDDNLVDCMCVILSADRCCTFGAEMKLSGNIQMSDTISDRSDAAS